jgi:tetratricopeptide (TPR) repeat protein
MGVAYREMGNYTQAISYYQKAISIDPNYSLAYYNMGVAYSDMENYTQALYNYRKAAQLGNENAQIWLEDNGYDW